MIALSALVAVASAQWTPQASSYVDAFMNACTKGQLSLPKEAIRPIEIKKLPWNVTFHYGRTGRQAYELVGDPPAYLVFFKNVRYLGYNNPTSCSISSTALPYRATIREVIRRLDPSVSESFFDSISKADYPYFFEYVAPDGTFLLTFYLVDMPDTMNVRVIVLGPELKQLYMMKRGQITRRALKRNERISGESVSQ